MTYQTQDASDLEARSATDRPAVEIGRVIALDLGTEKTGVAISDESRVALRRLCTLPKTSWKRFVEKIVQLCLEFDAQALVIGLPLNMDGSLGAGAEVALRFARNLQLSFTIPVFLQDERLTSRAALDELKDEGLRPAEIKEAIHSQSAVIILRDFLASPYEDRLRANEYTHSVNLASQETVANL